MDFWSHQPENVNFEQIIRGLNDDILPGTKCKIGFIYTDSFAKEKRVKMV